MSPEDFIRVYGVTMQATRRDPFPDPDPNGAFLLVGWDITLTHGHGSMVETFETLGYTTDVAVAALSLPHVLQELAGVALIGGMSYAAARMAADWDDTTDNRRVWQLWGTEGGRLHDWIPGTVGMWQDFLSLADK